MTAAEFITDEMVDNAARAHAALEGYDWSEVSEFWQRRYLGMARVILESALAGRVVVDLPEPDGSTDLGVEWKYDFGSVIVDEFSSAESARFMRRRALGLLAASVHIEQRLAAGVAGGDTR